VRQVPGRNTKKQATCWATVAHACNPSYSGRRDQEDHSSKPAREIVHETLPWKKSSQKKGWWSDSRWMHQTTDPLKQLNHGWFFLSFPFPPLNQSSLSIFFSLLLAYIHCTEFAFCWTLVFCCSVVCKMNLRERSAGVESWHNCLHLGLASWGGILPQPISSKLLLKTTQVCSLTVLQVRSAAGVPLGWIQAVSSTVPLKAACTPWLVAPSFLHLQYQQQFCCHVLLAARKCSPF
jgi:hypothetical protein